MVLRAKRCIPFFLRGPLWPSVFLRVASLLADHPAAPLVAKRSPATAGPVSDQYYCQGCRSGSHWEWHDIPRHNCNRAVFPPLRGLAHGPAVPTLR